MRHTQYLLELDDGRPASVPLGHPQLTFQTHHLLVTLVQLSLLGREPRLEKEGKDGSNGCYLM